MRDLRKLSIIILSKIRDNNSYLGKIYEQLVKKGKKKKVAIIACMRKFVVYLNGILKNNDCIEIMQK